MKQNENDQNHKGESTPVVDNKPNGKSQMKRVVKIVLVSLLLVFILFFLAGLFERWRGQLSVARFKRQLYTKGETLDSAKLIASPVADAENGASELLRLKALLHEGKVLINHYPPSMTWVAPGKAMVSLREDSWTDENKTNSWEGVSSDLAANEEVLGELRKLLTTAVFDFKPDHSEGVNMKLPDLAAGKALSFWFGASCKAELRSGKNVAALKDLLAAVAIPKVMENDHTVISELVRVAVSSINMGTIWEALQAEGWTDEQLALLQNAWEKNTFATNMVMSLRVERADGDRYFRASNNTVYISMFPTWIPTLSDEEQIAPAWWQKEFFKKQIYCRTWGMVWRFQDEAHYLKGVQLLIDDVRTGAERVIEEPEENWFGFGHIPPQSFYDNLRFGLSERSLADFSVASVKSIRAETARSLVLCAIALKRYQLRHQTPAPNLNVLVPEFLPSVPLDFMSGKPMKYLLQINGAPLLYSVGDDGKDDGGDASPATSSRQHYPGMWTGKDVVWPLPATPEEVKAWRDKAGN